MFLVLHSIIAKKSFGGHIIPLQTLLIFLYVCNKGQHLYSIPFLKPTIYQLLYIDGYVYITIW